MLTRILVVLSIALCLSPAAALSAARGNVADAARKLSTDRANLYRRMRRLGLEPPRT